MEDLRKYNIPPGEYSMPRAGSMKEISTPEFIEKQKNGPVNMGLSLFQWFLFSIVVGIFAAYISGRALGPGADYLAVFRFAGCTAFLGYTLAGWQNSIWFKRKWSTTLKNTIDGLIYALVTAGTFGWLWPA